MPESRPGGSEDPRVLVELVSLVEFTLQVKQVEDLSSQSDGSRVCLPNICLNQKYRDLSGLPRDVISSSMNQSTAPQSMKQTSQQ